MKEEMTLNNRYNLWINYFKSPFKKRQSEYFHTLLANISNKLINRVYVISGEDHLQHMNMKITKILGIERPTFNDFITLINRNTGPDVINIIANADIEFDETLSWIDKLGNNTMLCLTRWEKTTGELYSEEDKAEVSQDTWIFKGRFTNEIDVNFPMGCMGVYNRFAYEVVKSGYDVYNPCLSIRTWHNHSSFIRTYSPTTRVAGPYLKVPPCSIYDVK